jgi:ribosomal protection tetracycline resistance protein
VWRLPQRTLNLGILAHVDAGKTTLTERLLYAAGVIDRVGEVDAGTTQTDTLALERQRGITIKAAVVSFPVADVTVNLIDTPGHPDFIAEVERVLHLLDGAVLVVSAVEGVQPQTRILMRALRRLRVPTIVFVNKVDRMGADVDRVLAATRSRLAVAVVPMGTVVDAGTRAARSVPYAFDDPTFRARVTEVLADSDDSLLAAYVEQDFAVAAGRLYADLARLTHRCAVHPVFFGSAATGAGVQGLVDGLTDLLPAGSGDPHAAPCGRVFKIEAGPTGEKNTYVRMFTGTVGVRQRLRVERPEGGVTEAKPTSISVADTGRWVRRNELVAGEIGKLRGLDDVRIGDTIGTAPTATVGHRFAPPTMASVVAAVRPDDGGALRAALARLAEQDPLIDVRVDDAGREVSVSLYGEVQKEVLQATLAQDWGIDVTFRESTVVCVERPVGVGEAVEVLNAPSNPFHAEVGLRVEPGPPNSGLEFRMAVDAHAMPLYVYRNADAFADMMGRYVRRTLREGLYGWQVTDCVVTMIECGYSVADGPPSRRGPTSTPADYRNLTPIALMRALDDAGTVVCQPTLDVRVEVPVWAMNAVQTAVGRLGGAVRGQSVHGDLTTIETVVAAARVPELHRHLPSLTGGEGVMESTLAEYRPVPGAVPIRARTTVDPRHREQYVLSLTRHGGRG